MKSVPVISSVTALLMLSTGCAGPIGPPLGLGPGWDEIAGIAFVAVVVALTYRPVRRYFVRRYSAVSLASPQKIVKQRYARGEITQEEFQRIMQQLSQS